ncbi:MAG: alpha-2-macroglobulin, partial [Verrucomicrobia bacterium]|nr:alpha-2-macroglobulin [Verrucomicrobiota bacterium]
MRGNLRVYLIVLGAVLACCVGVAVMTPEPDMAAQREKARTLSNDGNYKEAYEIFSALALDRRDDPMLVGDDLTWALNCLNSLNRVNEMDAFREKVIEIHSKNWRLLVAAARSAMNYDHNGFMIAGKFERGHHRGGGKPVNAYERDRIRSLQLMEQAMKLTKGEEDKHAVGQFYQEFAGMFLGDRGSSRAWRLQYLSDLTTLPDYEDGYYGYYYYGEGQGGAPVDENGDPVFHKLPESYEAAQTDGERWRWLLMQAMEIDSAQTNVVRYAFASFLQSQFGVQTMARYGWYYPIREQTQTDPESDRVDESGPYEVHTLAENETIARLATGIKRFTLPDEFNYIRIYKQIADDRQWGCGEQALNTLAGIFQNRRQYDTAVTYWKRSIDEYGDHNGGKQQQIDQILGNWGRFEPILSQPAGKGATLEFVFRNGNKVRFEAHEINVAQLLDDIKTYLRSNPPRLDWNELNLHDIGYRLLTTDKEKYVGKQVAAWDLDLEPAPNHFDKRITVTTPLQKPGAYLLTSKMADGNTTHIVIWLNDTAIVRKPLDGKNLYYIADAVSGTPIEKANVEFFGYRQVRRDEKTGEVHHDVVTQSFAEFSDPDGQVIVDDKEQSHDYQWLIIARTEGGRFAFLGFSNVWYSRRYDSEYNQTKVYVVTDRPVYRPKQPVKFKFWVRHAKYDQENTSAFAGQSFSVEVRGPKNEIVFSKQFIADEYGGFNGEFMLEDEAMLGVYRIFIPGTGGSNFRVEEYKKPEFEVTVDAPTEPVMLGEKITATIKAKYYFGAPVTKATVKYKVLRSSHSANWYPWAYWDWFYGPGYWWYAYDYPWYPGWKHWGCSRPYWWWWPARHEPPEVVMQNEVEIGDDGTVKVEFDTAQTKAVHGDTDHRYEITAEVVDESRRTIVGQGVVLVARRPFKVYAWVNRGHYRVGDVVGASFSARTLDNKPVEGKGALELLRITYDKDNKPVETAVQTWELDTNDRGEASVQIKASRAGQYRLSYKVTDAKAHTIEGGYIFVVRGEGFDGKDYRFNELELVTDKREYADGETVNLMINTDRVGSTVLLFIRPANGIYLPPKIIRLTGKSTVEEIAVTKKDMPNFFIEAFTVADGKIYSEVREVIVPPEKRVLNVEVVPSAESYKPGEKAKVKVKLTDFFGEPFVGSVVMSVYDKSVEYISGGSNVPEIREFFWKWRRSH